MKRYIAKKKKVETTSEIGKICGFTARRNEEGKVNKGYLVYVGNTYRHLKAVIVEQTMEVPNASLGDEETKFASIKDFVENANDYFSRQAVAVSIDDIYFFDTLKEMHKWLSE